ncbi:PREDICTED: heparan-sulfate 6-O-sulfotransferase 3-like [Galeopterus variegatus]|uniref:Heparan-sulfate 6-O-sulfotransferase n=1 Tax=Galeopterus variegatus TaxID=482537 RepID=A0ABM0QZL8_GALVR|nr:PREDICTED: heparan-sulfate 6-O-sulfotransferase 3-like [Galeopterus variegatus]
MEELSTVSREETSTAWIHKEDRCEGTECQADQVPVHSQTREKLRIVKSQIVPATLSSGLFRPTFSFLPHLSAPQAEGIPPAAASEPRGAADSSPGNSSGAGGGFGACSVPRADPEQQCDSLAEAAPQRRRARCRCGGCSANLRRAPSALAAPAPRDLRLPPPPRGPPEGPRGAAAPEDENEEPGDPEGEEEEEEEEPDPEAPENGSLPRFVPRFNFTPKDLTRFVDFNIKGRDVIVFLHIQKTGGTTFGRHLVKNIRLEQPCSCKAGQKKCTCHRPGKKETWLFSRFSTGWSCGLHADWTELTNCVPAIMEKKDCPRNHSHTRYCPLPLFSLRPWATPRSLRVPGALQHLPSVGAEALGEG